MCTPEERNGKPSSLYVWLTTGGALLVIVCLMTSVYLKLYLNESVVGGNHTATEVAALNPVFLNGWAYVPPPSKKTCKPNACGAGANCLKGNCACPPWHTGDPTVKCTKLECSNDNDTCPEDQACVRYACVDACRSACGLNATCQVIKHIPVCSCPAGYGGNPFNKCIKVVKTVSFITGDACSPSPCGPNSVCRNFKNEAACSCLPGYKSSPPSCRPECESDDECGVQYACRDSKCVSPCIDCGVNAACEASAHRAVCECPKGYSGDPQSKCVPECDMDDECPSDRPLCERNSCVNPCVDDVCGVNAHCSVRGKQVFCSCPTNTTGDPFVFCRPPEALRGDELCDRSPCGTNATCSPVKSNISGEWYPDCSCPSGFFGHPYKSCQLDSDCEDETKACTGSECVDPCIDSACGVNAFCTRKSRRAACTCKEGTFGNPFEACSTEQIPLNTFFSILFGFNSSDSS